MGIIIGLDYTEDSADFVVDVTVDPTSTECVPVDVSSAIFENSPSIILSKLGTVF